MANKRVVDFLQNLILLALTASAFYLLTCFPMLDGVVSGKMQAFLTRPDNAVQKDVEISEMVAAVHFVVTDQNEYGRYALLNADTDAPEFQKIAPLFREAIGSASDLVETTEDELRSALQSPGVYVDLTASLPLSAVAAWLGEEYSVIDRVKALALVTTEETVMIYFCGADDRVVRCSSALTSAAVRELTAGFAPNGGQFAFESEHDGLAPYTVLVQEIADAVDISAEIPAGYTAYNLLTALDFNAHTNSRYFESSGVEVVVQSPFTLRIGSDGTVKFSTDGEVTSDLYRVSDTEGIPAAEDALRSAWGIAKALTEATSASELTLDSMEQTEHGWVLSFRYHFNGVPVWLVNDRTALRIVISGGAVTEFEYCCRKYAALEQQAELLPPTMAVAIAAMHTDAELTLAYIDNGSETLSARWFAR